MTLIAALTGPLPKAGIVVLALLAGAALLAGERRLRSAAVLGALVLAPALLLADIWHSPQLGVVHRHPLYAVLGALLGLGVVVALALLVLRRPTLLAMLVVLALPFRVPIQAGGTTSNLLVPLYLVVGAGSLAYAFAALRGRDSLAPAVQTAPPPYRAGWLERLLALYVALYAVQALYSTAFEKALQQMVFFYVPFALLFCLLRRVQWTPRLLRNCLTLLTGLALVFALLGFVEYETKTLLLNPKLIAANDVHAYFTVNSVFFDPDIFGRFLALVMIVLAAVLLYGSDSRRQVAVSVILAVLWGGLVLTLSRSSLAALLVGLGTLGALRWKAWPVVSAVVLLLVIGSAAIAIAPNTFGLNQGLNGASSGRAGLISGGVNLFAQRPVYGYGSGSFVHEYQRHHPGSATTLSASHTIPITIAAEQGVIGEIAYVALGLAAAALLVRGARASGPRAAVAAAFLALMFHTMLYADFLEDPVTWTLLGVGAALAAGARAEVRAAERQARQSRYAIARA